MSFGTRKELHDMLVPMLKAGFENAGYFAISDGQEVHDRLNVALKTDDLSLWKRYKPDLIVTHGGHSTFACELKTEYQGYYNFTIEFDSYAVSRKYPACHYCFVELVDETWLNLWILPTSQIAVPKKQVRVPTKRNYQVTLDRFWQSHPHYEFTCVPHNGGSGTPYFLVDKNDIMRLATWESSFMKWNNGHGLTTLEIDIHDKDQPTVSEVMRQLSLF